MAGKWLELLKEIAPHVNRVAFLFNPATATFAEIGWAPSKPPLRPSQWRRSRPLFATRPSSNLSLPHRHASRTAALSLCRIPLRSPTAPRSHR